MSTSSQLNDTRRLLEESLGDSKQLYFDMLKKWFQMKYTRERFVVESRNLLNNDQIRLHNAFLLNLINICNFPTDSSPANSIPTISSPTNSSPTISSPTNSSPTDDEQPSTSREKDKDKDTEKDKGKGKKSKSRKRTISDRANFEYAVFTDNAPLLRPLPSFLREEPIQNCQQELFLPDFSHMRGRMLVSAWENGLEGASEQAAECLVIAVQYFLKNILTSVFSQRSGYKVKDGRFTHAMGSFVPNPLLRNAPDCVRFKDNDYESDTDDSSSSSSSDGSETTELPSTEDSMRTDAMVEIAAVTPRTTAKAPVSAFDLLQALQNNRRHIPIPSHIVYSVNIARIIARLNHPTREELEGGQERDTKDLTY